ncbi:MAG: peptidoglycan DD-metalloendopeptidase family protein [Chloroflexi bacterium]|nr:peptidoglycan DD-metalloendopeptidase family protein [Chloroflexota bacterium]
MSFAAFGLQPLQDESWGIDNIVVSVGGQMYAVSGKVQDRNNDPVLSVTISAGAGGSTTTDADGAYTLSLPAGTYTLTPSKSGYSFSPEQRIVKVPGAASGADFIGVADGGPPPRFLDLPFAYSDSFAQLALGNMDGKGPGRVNSWFDHASPDYSENMTVTIWSGHVYTDPVVAKLNAKNCQTGVNCYNGHNGIDFQKKTGSDSIYPAAAGIVAEVRKHWPKPQKGSRDDSYGNYVLLDHGGGYATFYAHLASVNPAIDVGTVIAETRSITLGIMGGTGGWPIHLHFGIYYDKNGDDRWTRDEVVDPYGWSEKKSIPDPWVIAGGPVSHYLWKYDISKPSPVSANQGAVITETTSSMQISIPPNAFSGQATFELSLAPVAASSAQLRSGGHSFWLLLLEWLPSMGGQQAVGAQSQPLSLQSTTQFTLTKPITVSVQYTDADVLHLDVSQLTLSRWDETRQEWRPLPTTVDPINRKVTALTQQLGDFDLQAPLLCSTDDLEPDDNYAAARWVRPNDWPLARGLDTPQDTDWVRFDARQGITYTIRTQNLTGSADTILNLYDTDAWTLLASNDNRGDGPASELTWTAPYTGTFFVEVVSAPGGATNCSAAYELVIETIPGDVIPDCRVDVADLQAVANRWRLSAATPNPDEDVTTPNYETRFDLDRDGDVDVVDIMHVAAQWGERCS